MLNFLAINTTDIVMIILWALVVIAALVIEFETANLVSIWFAAGGIFGILSAVLGVQPWLQIIIVVLASAIFVIGTRPFVKKISDNQTILTNADRLVGMTAIVTKEIKDGEKGEVKVDFQNWPAISKDEKTFIVGDKVLIKEIIGNKLIVEELKEITLE